MSEEKNVAVPKTLNEDQLIALMSVYLSEWEHRDELLWVQVFKIFYANVIVIVLPNIAAFIEIELPDINRKLFPIIGMLMAIVFLYISIGSIMRLKAIKLSYMKTMELLGNEKYECISIKDKSKIKWGYLFNTSLADVLVVTMFIALELLAIVLLYLP